MAIDYIVGKNKYPEWFYGHRVFQSMDRIEKVFPDIGLSNFIAECQLNQSDVAKSHSDNFLRWCASQSYDAKTAAAYAIQGKGSATTDAQRKELNALWAMKNLTGAFHEYLNISYPKCVLVHEGRIKLILDQDIYLGELNSDKPFLPKGMSFIRAIEKTKELVSPLPGRYFDYENNVYFRSFSATNVPEKPFPIHFSSTGEKGAWDIATASMRGISSCQGWHALQSRGLIGSVVSKYVGIMFIEGTSDYPPYGKQMLHRAFVRLIINKRTAEPYLFIDNCYPSNNLAAVAAMKKAIQDRTAIKVMAYATPGERDFVMRECILMDEPSRAYLRMGEYSYQDTGFSIGSRPISVLTPKSLLERNYLPQAKTFVKTLVVNALKERYDRYVTLSQDYRNLAARREAKEEGVPDHPDYTPLFSEKLRGPRSIASVLNFYEHFAKKVGIEPWVVFIDAVLQSVDPMKISGSSEFLTKLSLLRHLTVDTIDLKTRTVRVLSTGSWNKDFRRTSDRFLDTVLLVAKKEMVRELRKK